MSGRVKPRHPVDAAAGRGGRGAEEKARVWGGVGNRARHGSEEELREIGDSTGDRAADEGRIVRFEIRRCEHMTCEDTALEAGREAFDLRLDGACHVDGR